MPNLDAHESNRLIEELASDDRASSNRLTSELEVLSRTYRGLSETDGNVRLNERIAELTVPPPLPDRGFPRTLTAIQEHDARVRMAEDFLEVDYSEPLPLRLTTTRYLRDEERVLYARTRDGGFRLTAFYDDDAATEAFLVQEHPELLLTLRRVPRGSTPQQVAHEEAHKQALESLIAKDLAALELARKQDALEAEHARTRARMEAELQATYRRR